MENVRTIIFDLGGVLLDIDFKRTFAAFDKLGVPGFEQLYSQYNADPFFSDFEKGKIPTPQFFDKIREICQLPLTDDAITNAWNALLISFAPAKIEWFQAIRKKYPVYLFSNTNIIHYQWFSKQYYNQTGEEFNQQFIKAYYSHEMGLRKPDPESYQFIINEQNLDPDTTLFIDDTLKNVEAARQTGLQAFHLIPGTGLDSIGL